MQPQLFEAVGLGTTAATVYTLVVHEPGLTRRNLAERLTLSPKQVDRALTTLRDVGLVRPSESPTSGAVVPIDPTVGLGGLVRSRRSQLERIAGLSEELADHFRGTHLRVDPCQLVEVLDGKNAIAARMAELLGGAREEILSLNAQPLEIVDQVTSDDGLGAPASGVRTRVIYPVESLREDRMRDVVLCAVASEEDARVLRNVPLNLLIVDRTWAILPLTLSQIGTSGSALLVHRSQVTAALVSLFETLWVQASPITAAERLIRDDGINPANPADVRLLQLLAAGLKDETIASHLNVSERTLRRRMSDLLDRLDATSRFQAGIQASRRGWL